MDLKVNAEEWKALGAEGQKKVQDIIGGFFKDSKIVPDPATPKTSPHKPLGNPFCEAACTIAENAAKTACLGLGNPILIALCIAAATEAGKACRSKC